MGYFLANPLRRLVQNPEKILQPYVKEGMRVMDVGSAMGFFTLPLARLVGDQGRVIAVDLQEKMIRSLERRAHKAGLASRIETRICSSTSLNIDDLAGSVDVALAFAVLHEMPDNAAAILSIARSLKGGGLFLMAEPAGHVSAEGFRQASNVALQQGLEVVSKPVIWHSHAVVLRKPAAVKS
ncbi:MAG: class I SAM-dependent methyltransferase [Candidatus Zixiibacteriota bacterium]|nr:MAG: class I SAM-dependent methyltransferase [candidate division Zixibacteria bacterium]